LSPAVPLSRAGLQRPTSRRLASPMNGGAMYVYLVNGRPGRGWPI